MAQSHYFKPSQDLEHQVRKIKYTIAQQDFEFYTDRGFSPVTKLITEQMLC